ncbi:hypothetical protein F1188_02890 [Roseospira marina]|uniref:Endonuclease/exonuclease/phosphatase domain-containing protein n=1 Tax=Roseospira marina TaxID=140057 RepID=A0A5M6IH38_9PROT|nr:endonuclease/exonuclease/phosphatase family protein [Roseospira marina]KAA5606878.1 hypothetical protein F1188_02890 [Roseospira marina]MBB4312954.1 endonuclease/exonuclease/phosphatase (EEP) superfamily protein YafD [Roseospira marina]
MADRSPAGGVDRALVAALGLIAVISPLVALSWRFWLAEIPLTLLPILVALAVLLAAWLAALRHGFAALLFLAFGVVDLGVMLGAVGPPTLSAASEVPCARPLRVASLNVLFSTGNWASQEAYLRNGGFDVVLLQEIFADGYWLGRLRALSETYPYLMTHRGSDSAILSTRPLRALPPRLQNATALTTPILGNVPVAAMVAVGDREVLVVSAHMPSPKTPDAYAGRSLALHHLAALITTAEGPAIVAGDFNGVAWSPRIAAFREAAGLSMLDWGPLPIATRPAWLPVLGAQIDYVLPTASDFTGVQRAGPDVGSDHRPLEADLCPRF